MDAFYDLGILVLKNIANEDILKYFINVSIYLWKSLVL